MIGPIIPNHRPHHQSALASMALLALLAFASPAHAAITDCNNNAVDDATDIANQTSEDCDLNAVPDDCQPDLDTDGIIDACDSCGDRLTDTDLDEDWSLRQKTTSQGRVLWFDEDSTVSYFNGTDADLIQQKDANDPTLDDVADFAFSLGSGENDGEVIGAWRRGTDYAWVWQNNGDPPTLVDAENPYDPNEPNNPEALAIADGCVFLVLQTFDPNTADLIKHVFKVDPASGDAELLTGDFLDDIQDGGIGAWSTNFVTDQCRAAWPWCKKGMNGNCDADGLELHYYDGSSVSVIDDNAIPQAFALGRLIYIKPVGAIDQLFLFDANAANPAPEQLTDFDANDPKLIAAQTDGRHVAILVGDANGDNRQIITLGGFAVTDNDTQPADQPSNFNFPIQVDRAELLWETQDKSVLVFDGYHVDTACADGWLADGNVASLRKTDAVNPNFDVFLKSVGAPTELGVPAPPWIVEIEATANGEATLEWEPILGTTSYNIYYAQDPGLNKSNYLLFTGGARVTGILSNSAVVTGLPGNVKSYFVVTALEDALEGPVSTEVHVIACTDDASDTDADGLPDCEDGCPNDPAKGAPGDCGCGQPDSDLNGNGIADCLDALNGPAPLPTDACGICGNGSPLALLPLMLWFVLGRSRIRRPDQRRDRTDQSRDRSDQSRDRKGAPRELSNTKQPPHRANTPLGFSYPDRPALLPTPKALHPPAQGCAEGATLGQPRKHPLPQRGYASSVPDNNAPASRA